MEDALPEALYALGLEKRYAISIGRDAEAALLLVRIARMIAIHGADNVGVNRRGGITEEEAKAAVRAAASAKHRFLLGDVAVELCIERSSLYQKPPHHIIKAIRQEAAGFRNCGMRKLK
jgi:hypothetical protein